MQPALETTVSEALLSATAQINQALEDDSAEVDGRILLQHCLKKDHSYLLTWPEKQLTQTENDCFEKLLQRRLTGEPIAYIVGHREFWSMKLKVTEDTLIPRPETELLVELALAKLSKDKKYRVLDMGTGSGAIALAIASERSASKVLASDISSAALQVARENAQIFKLTNINFVKSDWGKNIPEQKFDLIVSNPPYIEKNDPHLQQGDLRFEPEIALAAASDGLSDLKTVIEFAQERLNENGSLLMEHGYNQHQAVAELLRQAGFVKVQSHQDIFGNYRVSGGVCCI